MTRSFGTIVSCCMCLSESIQFSFIDIWLLVFITMSTISTVPKNNSDLAIVTIRDDVQCPSVVKEFFSYLSIDVEKNRWTSRCKMCSSSISDTYKTTSNFLKYLKLKHQVMFEKWKKMKILAIR